jgi:hypothetical protein
MLAHLGVQKLSPFLELLLVDFAARKALLENVAAAIAQSTINTLFSWFSLTSVSSRTYSNSL